MQKKAGNKVKRWQAISESAAKQSKRSRIPEVHAVMNFKDAVEYAKLQDMILVPMRMSVVWKQPGKH